MVSPTFSTKPVAVFQAFDAVSAIQFPVSQTRSTKVLLPRDYDFISNSVSISHKILTKALDYSVSSFLDTSTIYFSFINAALSDCNSDASNSSFANLSIYGIINSRSYFAR